MRISDWSSDVCSSDLVGVGGVEEMPGLRHGDHRHRVLAALGGDGGAFERIEGDVEGRAAGADLLADEQHRRLVALALADHHRAVALPAVPPLAHGVDGGPLWKDGA